MNHQTGYQGKILESGYTDNRIETIQKEPLTAKNRGMGAGSDVKLRQNDPFLSNAAVGATCTITTGCPEKNLTQFLL